MKRNIGTHTSFIVLIFGKDLLPVSYFHKVRLRPPPFQSLLKLCMSAENQEARPATTDGLQGNIGAVPERTPDQKLFVIVEIAGPDAVRGRLHRDLQRRTRSWSWKVIGNNIRNILPSDGEAEEIGARKRWQGAA